MPYVPPGDTTSVLAIPRPEPGFEYRWIADDVDRMSGHMTAHGDRPGYVFVQGKTVPETRKLCEQLGLPSTYVNELTNRIQYGRLLLAKIPAVEARARRQERIDDNRARREAARDRYMARTEARGVRPFERELGEVLDRREHATREERGAPSPVFVPDNYPGGAASRGPNEP